MAKDTLVPKTEANYKAAGGDTPCASCKNFIPPAACALVAGTIAEGATCDFFEAKEGGASPVDLESMLFGGGAPQ